MKMTEKYNMAYWQATLLLLFIYFDAQDGSLIIQICDLKIANQAWSCTCLIPATWEKIGSLKIALSTYEARLKKSKTNKQEEEGGKRRKKKKKRAGENIMVRFTERSNLSADILGCMS